MRSLVTSLLYLCYIKLILFVDLLLKVILAFFINFRYEKMMNYSCCFQEENKFIFCNSVQCDRDKREKNFENKIIFKKDNQKTVMCFANKFHFKKNYFYIWLIRNTNS